MKHIVDDYGNVHSMSGEHYLAMKCSSRFLKFNVNILYDEITLSIGQEWYIQQGEDINLAKYRIVELTDKIVTMRNIDHSYMTFTREFKHLKFIERIS